MNNPTSNAHDLFWLARYAHNIIDPLIAAAQQHEPSISFRIDMRFRHVKKWNPEGYSLCLYSHWDRDLMFFQTIGIRTKAEVDAVADKVREFIKSEQEAAA